jgi:hypothetical protein
LYMLPSPSPEGKRIPFVERAIPNARRG